MCPLKNDFKIRKPKGFRIFKSDTELTSDMSTWEEITLPVNFYKFVINGQPYRIGEIELYYFCSNHLDHYVHKDPLQLEFDNIYFHRYKNGSYKGMDFSFGRKSENIYLSLLIRTIQNCNTGEVITGPCNTVNHILSVLGHQSVENLVTTAGGTINFTIPNTFIYLQPQSSCLSEDILHGPRVGLSDKYPTFKNLSYRFVSSKMIKQIKKQKTGLQIFWRQS